MSNCVISKLSLDTVFDPNINGIFAKLAEFFNTNELAALSQTCKKLKNSCNKKFVYYCDILDFDNITMKNIHTFKNLKKLHIHNKHITDISPLSSLTDLQVLIITACDKIVDISPLSSLVNLQDLDLHCNHIFDLTPLAKLVKLKKLDISNNKIKNILLLAGLVNLYKLHLGGNYITDISPLSNLVKLRDLCISDNQVVSIAPLADLVDLEKLDINYNQISNLKPLANLFKLQILDLGRNKIVDLSPVNISNLRMLHIYGNQITDFTHLDNLSSYCIFQK